jgi:hypothetical protein
MRKRTPIFESEHRVAMLTALGEDHCAKLLQRYSDIEYRRTVMARPKKAQ